MIDELGLSATVIQETIGSEVARFRFTAAAQSYRDLIIGREPTILVISGSQFGNSDVWHATLRRSWEAPHSINHSVTRIASHLPIDLPPPSLSLSLSKHPRNGCAYEFVFIARTRDLNLSRMSTMIRVSSSRFAGCHQPVIRRNGFTSLLVSSRILPRQEERFP